MPSEYFPHINLSALKKWAISTAAKQHPVRNVSRRGGKPASLASPKIIVCEDVMWAGEKMIQITFDPASLPMGPRVMLAHFPIGRPQLTTQALVGMTDTVLKFTPARIGAPKVYASIDQIPNEIGAEVVLLEKVAGENMVDVWPTLPPDLQFLVLVKIAEILCYMFNFRGSLMCTDLLGTRTDTRPMMSTTQPMTTHRPIILAPAFNQYPLNEMEPIPAFESSQEYLTKLAYRIESVFTETRSGEPTEHNLKARKSRLAGAPDLTYLQVQRVKDTWARLASLIPYHTGGAYIPVDLPRRAREEAGWEHAHRAPLWSCAILPHFLTAQVGPNIIPDDQKPYYRDLFVGKIMADDRLLRVSWQWFVAHVYGEAERWFEACLSTHWQLRDQVEYLLPFLRNYWNIHQTRPFPIPVGREYGAAPGDTSMSAEEREEIEPNPQHMAIDKGSGNIGNTLGAEWNTIKNKWIAYVPKKK